MTTTPTGQDAVDLLLRVLDLERLGEASFRGMSPPVGPQARVSVARSPARLWWAAGRTVDPARTVHSLHGYFVRGGDPAEPIVYEVENVRDGRVVLRPSVGSDPTRQADLLHVGLVPPRRKRAWIIRSRAPVEPCLGPDELPTMSERLAHAPERQNIWAVIPRPIDVRYVGEPGWVRPGDRPAAERQQVWMRIDGKLPDDPLVHACALTFASDLTLLDSVLSTHGEVWGPGGYIGAKP